MMAVRIFLGVALVALCGCSEAQKVSKSIFIYNEDDSHFFWGQRNITKGELEAYIDKIAASNVITHFFVCPNAMRANFDSKVIEPAWAPCDVPGWQPTSWGKTLKSLHDRGIDPYAVWIARCREKGISPWISVRMNDIHGHNDFTYGGHSKFWREHPQFWRKPNFTKPSAWGTRALDYAHKEVRDYFLDFIREVLGRYDVDGVECDWMRFPNHLTPGHERELAPCLNEFMAKVRQIADAAAKRCGHPVKVGVRVETEPEVALARGTDAIAWAREGNVDLIVPCNFFESVDFELPFSDWKAKVLAVNPHVDVVPGIDAGVVIGKEKRRYLTKAEYCGWADRVYSQGAKGIYYFNLFTHSATNGVWEMCVNEGLTPGYVASHEKSIPAGAIRECAGILKRLAAEKANGQKQ